MVLAAYLVSSQTPGMSAVQFQRQLDLKRYKTAFQILHKLRSAMVRRIAKRGENAGNVFWGCTGHPGCRGLRAI